MNEPEVVTKTDMACHAVEELDESEQDDIDAMIFKCLICEKPVPEYEPTFCCLGIDCGCMGQPIEPCVCSDRCWNALIMGIGVSYNARRILAGIGRYGDE
jgi:hypothetical protein